MFVSAAKGTLQEIPDPQRSLWSWAVSPLIPLEAGMRTSGGGLSVEDDLRHGLFLDTESIVDFTLLGARV